MITVIRPGTLTTVQDLGRFGYQAWGMPASGVMDFYAAKAANILAGNSTKAAVLEMTAEGGTYRFEEETLVAVTGAQAEITVNGIRHTTWSSFLVPPGGILHIGTMTQGQRMYLALQGGLDTPVVMGSRSTYLSAGLGGLEGRPLQAGDILFAGNYIKIRRHPCQVPARFQLAMENPWQLFVTAGSQEDWLSAKDKRAFYSSTYTIEHEVPRMSYRLQGPLLTSIQEELISEPTGLGAVEVPSSGKLFIVLPDHGTSRGFAKIAYIIHAHFYKLAQAACGDKITFKKIDVDTAADLYRSQETALHCLIEELDNNSL